MQKNIIIMSSQKKCIIAIAFILFLTIGNAAKTQAQVVYSTQYSSDANIKVYVTQYKSDADLVVYKCQYKSDADGNTGLWYFTEYSSDAKKKLYFTQYKSDAEWKNKSKQQLMY